MKKNKKPVQKKRGAKLGQHFLTSNSIATSVADAAEIAGGETVLEIGPGKGILTEALLRKGARVVAVEKDPAMVLILNEKFAENIQNKQLIIHEGDAREFTPDILFPKEKYKVTANIPYYITGELIRACMTSKNQPTAIAFLVQKEVAERIARSKKESILSLSVKVYGTPQYVKTVKRGSFNPPPGVDSAILSIKNISHDALKNSSDENFFKVVKAGFAQKRKTLLGNLKKTFPPWLVERAWSLCALTAGTRAEDVSLQKWIVLTEHLTEGT